MRGKPKIYRHRQTLTRSIPACAGEAAGRPGGGGAYRVYPRVCGGSAACTSRLTCKWGLSPRVRGKRGTARPGAARPGVYPRVCGGSATVRGAVIDRARSIPACAGEAYAGILDGDPPPVYPRVCGGSRTPPGASSPAAGLSPRVRGKRLGGFLLRRPPWSIPACAGEASADYNPTARARVYPRVCGGSPYPSPHRFPG